MKHPFLVPRFYSPLIKINLKKKKKKLTRRKEGEEEPSPSNISTSDYWDGAKPRNISTFADRESSSPPPGAFFLLASQ